MQGEDITENLHKNAWDPREHRHIGKDAKAAMKQLVAEELEMLVDESLIDILHSSLTIG